MGPNGCKWVQIGENGSQCVQTGANWCECVQNGANGLKWVQIGLVIKTFFICFPKVLSPEGSSLII